MYNFKRIAQSINKASIKRRSSQLANHMGSIRSIYHFTGCINKLMVKHQKSKNYNSKLQKA